MSEQQRTNRGRWQIIALAVLFFGPAIAAWVLVLIGWQPGGTVNHGELIQPPVEVVPADWQVRGGESLVQEDFKGVWTLLLVEKDGCDKQCAGVLDELRRIRVALDKDAKRVRVLLLQGEGSEAPQGKARFDALVPAVAKQADIASLLDDSVADSPERAVYVLDYLGYRMMEYKLPLDSSGMLDDLERLLRIANQDVEQYQQLQKQEDAHDE